MKILIVIDTLATGGAQRLKVELAKGLVKGGHSVEFFIYDDNYNFFETTLKEHDIKIYTCNRKSQGFSIKVVSELRKLIKHSEYDHVISSLHAPSIYSALALVGIRKTLLTVCEESSSLAKVSFIKKLMFYFATLIANNLVTNSYNEFELIKKLPGRRKKTKVIWNGFNLSSINFVKNPNYQKRGIKKLLVVGRVAYPKNGLNLLKALSIFESRNGWVPEVNWIGRKDLDARSQKDKKSQEMINQMDDYLKHHEILRNNWKWLGTVKDVYSYYNSSDALMSVSLYEGMPMVICEAMLTGCFVIASNVCDHPKVLDNGSRGLLCDPMSPMSICNAIETLNNMDAEQKKEVVKKARDFAAINFNNEKMIDSYESLIIKK